MSESLKKYDWSAYKMGWIIAIFDLPVMTKAQRREATTFRKNLLDDGFVMIQYSVYARPCVTRDSIEQHAKRIETISPETGNVRLLFLTDHQWSQTITILSTEYCSTIEEPEMPDQIEFW